VTAQGDNEKDASSDEDGPPSIQLRKGSDYHGRGSKARCESCNAHEDSRLAHIPLFGHLLASWAIRAGRVGRNDGYEAGKPYGESLARF